MFKAYTYILYMYTCIYTHIYTFIQVIHIKYYVTDIWAESSRKPKKAKVRDPADVYLHV